ncbi:MAG: hypothetical protein SOZ62_01880 [Eubacteriales bacterium]|nr:hypothetical protein [Eubacteriales bacterium]
MINKKKLTVIFSSLFVLFLVLSLIVINPFAKDDDTNTGKEPPEYDPSVGESTYMNSPTMYDSYGESELTSITVKNSEGIYRVNKTNGTWTMELFCGDNYGEQKEDAEKWIAVSLLSLDGKKLAALRVAVGISYYKSKTVVDTSDTQTLETYGLSDGNMFYEFCATKDGNTVKKKVYVGAYSRTLKNYYLMIDGTDRVYVSAGNLTALFAEPEYFVTPQITVPASNRANYYMNDFSIYKNTDIIFKNTEGISEEDKTVRRGDIVEVTYYVSGEQDSEDDTLVWLIDTADRSLPNSLVNNLIGMKTGESKTFTVEYPADYNEKIYTAGNFSWLNLKWFRATGDYTMTEKASSYQKDSYTAQGVRYVMKINNIMRSQEEFIKVDWLNESDRSSFFRYTTYETYGSKDKYTVNTDNFFNIAELFENISAGEVVSLTLTPDDMKKYGLDAYTIYYKMPEGIEAKKDTENIDMCTYKYLENALFISEIQADGTRYVGSWYYDIVVKISDEEGFSFLNWDFYEYVENYMFSTALKYVKSLDFSFNYRDKGAENYRLEYIHTIDKDNEDAYTTDVYLNGQKVDSDMHAKLYTYLSAMQYDGMCTLTDSEAEALYSDDSRCILTLTFTLDDKYGGESRTFRFCPYSSDEDPERHSLVSRGDGVYFSTVSANVEKIYRDINRLKNGESIDYNDRY